MSLSLFQYNIISLILLLPVIINLLSWQNNYVSAIFGGVFLFFNSLLIGSSIKNQHSTSRQIIIGLFFIFLLLIIIGTPLYYLIGQPIAVQILIYLSIPGIGSFLITRKKESWQPSLEIPMSWKIAKLAPKAWVLLSSYILLYFVLLWNIFSGITNQAITSPWNQLPTSFFYIYFLATAILLIFVFFIQAGRISTILAALHIFITCSIALIIYQISYGFDPILHLATERLIDLQGVVEPKPFYYIGQYTLFVSLKRLVGIPLIYINKFFTPFILSISLPLLWQEVVKTKHANFSLLKNNGVWLSLLVLLIPFASFTLTTPQSLSNILYIWILLLALPMLTNAPHAFPLISAWIIAIAAIFIHPLAGIPALIFCVALTYNLFQTKLSLPKWIRSFLSLEFFILSSISIPLVFLVNGLVSKSSTAVFKPISEINLSDIASWWPVQIFLLPSQFRSLFFESSYFVSRNIWWIVLSLVFIFLGWLVIHGKVKLMNTYLITFTILLLNAVILSTAISFPQIISYEVQTYPTRMFELAFWSLLPLLGLGLVWLVKKFKTTNIHFFIFLILIFSWFVTSNLYFAYPRDNKYEIGRQYSTSQTDIKTVKAIETNASEDYIVLANQSVSAAAINEYGFRKYFPYQEELVFYYPVPTSSPTYELFLQMVQDKPTKEVAKKASEISNTSEVYFVLNSYWDNAETTKEIAKLEADDWFEIDEGKSTVFIYQFDQE